MKKVCVVTTTRAEYGLLRPLLFALQNDADIKLQLVVSGTHFTRSFGNTYKEIERDFHITAKVPMGFESDRKGSLSLQMAQLQGDMSRCFIELAPDRVILLGDRYEILSVAIAAMMLQIPLGHIHGGELTQGAMDESIRHAITKMSHLHFCATEVYRKRVLQLGENPDMVFNVGSLGVENSKNITLLEKDAFVKSTRIGFNKKNILITFHPTTLGGDAAQEFEALLQAVDTLEDTTLIFTKANADSGGELINTMIDAYVSQNSFKAYAFASLGLVDYLSALQFVDIVLGNSSSGIIEVPSFAKATINIGERQKGRLMAESIIGCEANTQSIQKAIAKAYSKEFQQILDIVQNPYESDGKTSSKIVDIIKSTEINLQKPFYDLEC